LYTSARGIYTELRAKQKGKGGREAQGAEQDAGGSPSEESSRSGKQDLNTSTTTTDIMMAQKDNFDLQAAQEKIARFQERLSQRSPHSSATYPNILGGAFRDVWERARRAREPPRQPI
jgi:hypothetical protein